MMFSKGVYSVLVLMIFWQTEGILCKENEKSGNDISGLNPSFYLTTDFILHLNELIKHLAVYALDDTVDSRHALDHAGAMWNHTEAVLEELLQRSASDNATNISLHDALDAIQRERIHFMKRVSDIDATALIERSGKYPAAITHTMQSSVHGLANVSAKLLRVLAGTSEGTGRANPTNATVDLFLDVFNRAIVDTQENFQTQINRALRRVKARLASLDATTALGQYLMKLAELYALQKSDINAKLALIGMSVSEKMEAFSTMVDSQLTAGLTGLLTDAATSSGHQFLYLCLKRYVYSYFDEARAVAKLLHCGEPELSTLQYLVTVAGPILERAAISDSSATKMNAICSSTVCTDFYYLSLGDQILLVDSRIQSYVAFIHSELAELELRVYTCVQAASMDMDAYVTTIRSRFGVCLTSGNVNFVNGA
ncbi:uncharacterized protein LOC121595256 [Anopheles merus]|uniref:uncharacterized protein LOC121595256 n=1 Tax=Anopheles merus TaxID=30066 RepID=UPI001BE40B8D|nr:uncharacterized protein LOC121595256 [Anopheles merus]